MDKPIYEITPQEKKAGIPKAYGIPASGVGAGYNGYYVALSYPYPIGLGPYYNQATELDFTTGPGDASSLYFSLVFQIPKWSFNIVKVDEWIEVSPTHQEYYTRVNAAKQQLEGQIKQGLASASSAISDYELVAHDLRKYKEIMNYFAKDDEHSLRAMFIDQVDVHNGAMAMVQMVQRWSTLISDFQRLDDTHIDADKIVKDLQISRAEAIILTTKNKIYLEWKTMFKEATVERYGRIHGLVEARKKSIEEYREWLKPYITRFKLMRLKHEREGMHTGTMKSFADLTGQSTFENYIRLWVWKKYEIQEHKKPAKEHYNEAEGFELWPYDDYVRENFILNNKTGLSSPRFYPWLKNLRKYCENCKEFHKPHEVEWRKRCAKCNSFLKDKTIADEIVLTEIIPKFKNMEMYLDPLYKYYIFMEIHVKRVGARLPTGELENIIFTIKNNMISQNIMLVKLLELRCREIDLERTVGSMLGVSPMDSEKYGMEISDIVKQEYPDLHGKEKEPDKSSGEQFREEWHSVSEKISKFTSNLGKKSDSASKWFIKSGNYERDFNDRMTKQYAKPAGSSFGQVVNFLKAKAGVR